MADVGDGLRNSLKSEGWSLVTADGGNRKTLTYDVVSDAPSIGCGLNDFHQWLLLAGSRDEVGVRWNVKAVRKGVSWAGDGGS